MNSLESSLYTAASTLCVFAAGVLRRRHRADWGVTWLTWFLVLEAAAFSLELLMAHPAMPYKALWLGLRLATALLVGPCLWLAVREVAEGKRPSWREVGRRPGAAILLGALLTLPLLARAHGGTTYANPADPVSWLHSKIIHAGMLGCIAIFAVETPRFLWRCRQLLFRRAAERGDSPAWLQLPLAIVATTWALGLLRTLQCATHAPRELALALALADVGVTVGAVYFLVRRAPFLEALPPAPAVGEVSRPATPVSPPPVASPAVAPPTVKYERSQLDTATRARIRRKLEEALGAQEAWRDSLLNLRSLSRTINEKAHYVSQVINQDLATSFYDLVNRYRVDAAARQLLANPRQTVLEIALAVGFNSKSTFHTAFRRAMGMTPTEYRTAHQKE